MYVLGITGPSESGKTLLVERLLDSLDGQIATIKHCTHQPDIDTEQKDTARHRDAGATTTYGLADEHGWFATGETRSLNETLDELAHSYDYALVEGFHWASIPHVELGSREGNGKTLMRASHGDSVDVKKLTELLHDTEPYITLSSLVHRIKQSTKSEYSGAIATFTGRVRRLDGPEDSPTEHLTFEKYEDVADQRLTELCSELESRDGVYRVLAHHKTGTIPAEDDIVYVVVLAGHRREAFDTVEDGIDRLKEEVPIFKKEITVDDEFWRHDTPS